MVIIITLLMYQLYVILEIPITAVFASKNGKDFPVDIAVFSFLLWKGAIVINMYDGLSNLRSETRLKLLNL